MNSPESKISTAGALKAFFLSNKACSGGLCEVLNHSFDQPLPEEESAAMLLAGGILQHGFQCGMIWGAALAAGARAYALLGPGPNAEAKAILAAQQLVDAFRAQNNAIDCSDLTELDAASSTVKMMIFFLIKGGVVRCAHRVSRFARVAATCVDAALATESAEILPAPVSCSALVARKAGMSEMHIVMASGLAGGIGLSGGGCGALGTAVWIRGLNRLKSGESKLAYKDPSDMETVEEFLKCSDYEFECSQIVGRRFESVADHAGYICNGGCSRIIDVMADRGRHAGV